MVAKRDNKRRDNKTISSINEEDYFNKMNDAALKNIKGNKADAESETEKEE